MPALSTLPRVALLAGFLVLGLWLARLGGWIPDRAPLPHTHEHPQTLPPPTFSPGPGGKIPDYGELPAFSLIETSGQVVTRDGLRGRPWVASFLFTHCAGTCPTTTARLRILQRIIPEEALLVSLSVDPTRDTPEVLGAFASQNQRIPDRWILLTGAPETVQELTVRGFYLGEEGALLHSTRLALVDSRGHLRGFYESTDEKAIASLLRDLAILTNLPK